MVKKLAIVLLLLIVIIGALAGTKFLQIKKLIAQGEAFVPPPAIVSTIETAREVWTPSLNAIGSLEAVQGVTLTAELSGKVIRVSIESGAQVAQGDLLLQQDVSTEAAQLKAARAQQKLAVSNERRLAKLLKQRMISQSEYDEAAANLQQAEAEIVRLQAVIAKKTIRAPFSGTLGIRQINLGQTLLGGEQIVSLQSLDPIYVNFSLPQQQLKNLTTGQTIRITTDALPDSELEGILTAMNPEVDEATRNVKLQATLPNPDHRLRPGMFVQVALPLPQQDASLILPATAVLYAPYGDSVFRLSPGPADPSGNPSQVLEQVFVRLGRTRGDFVEILEGLKEGDMVASTGVFKLRNGQTAMVNNSLNPEFKRDPKPADQ